MEDFWSVEFTIKAVCHLQIRIIHFFPLQSIKGGTVRVALYVQTLFKEFNWTGWRIFSSPAFPETRVFFFLAFIQFSFMQLFYE